MSGASPSTATQHQAYLRAPAFCRGSLASVWLLLGLFGAVGPTLAQFPDVNLVDQVDFPGITHSGTDRLRNTGRSLASLGDVNGDGRPDLLVGADGGGVLPGRAYLLLGGVTGPLRRELPGTAETAIELRTGSAGPDRLGSFVAAAGDVDGDGLDDLLVGMASEGHPLVPAGGVFLIFGSTHPGPIPELLGSPPGAVFFTFVAAPGLLGLAGAGGFDLNSDGFDDIALGMPGAVTTREGQPPRVTGKVLVVLGGPALRSGPAVVTLDDLAPPHGVTLDGFAPASELGFSLAACGDWNGDGHDDLAVGAPRLHGTGAAFVILGTAGIRVPNLAAPDGIAAVELLGSPLDIRAGHALAGGADATGDSMPDLLLGAPETGRDGGPAGVAYLAPGRATNPGEGVISLTGAGNTLFRGTRGSATGSAVAFVPDLNGSGRAEVLIGAPGQRAGRGAAYLAYDGGGPDTAVLLESLDAPAGAVFLVDAPDAQLGRAVAGLPDRNADRRGDFALGAPGLPRRDVPGVGAVFEVVPPVDPASPAPRSLTARIVPGPHVLLTWAISTQYRSLRVYRDGEALGQPLEGVALKYLDTTAVPGRHVYVVEADGNPALRSNLAEVFLRRLPVRELECAQLDGTLRVRLTWVVGDEYEALQVLVDGRPVGALLPPHATSVEVDVARGEHVFEVLDPTAEPPGERAVCKLLVTEPELPAVAGFTCTLEGPRSVRLAWQPHPAYDLYEILRNGIKVGSRLQEGSSSYLDAEAPVGPLRYVLIGLNSSLHRGPAAVCEITVPPEGAQLLRGAVSWAGGARLRSGVVRVRNAINLITQGQVGDDGRFTVAVTGPPPFNVEYEGRVEGRESHGVPALLETRRVQAAIRVESAAEEADLTLPPPILLVSSPAAEGTSDDALRWRALRERVGTRALTFSIVLPPGAARAASKLARDWQAIELHLVGELGSSPPRLDLVAYGFAGLGARAFVAGQDNGLVRRLVLLGTPNLGTQRGQPEARGDLAPRPRLDGNRAPAAGELQFKGGAEQTQEFLEHFNALVARTAGADVHLVAGTAGLDSLDAVLHCDAHDDRVCEASALGGIPGASLHRVAENHETLGRGVASIRLLAGPILGLEAAGGAGAELEESGEGAGVFDPSFPPSTIYSGVLEPGGQGSLPLTSDTSESIIIILNSDLPGGMRFDLLTPSGESLTPQSAAREDVDYQILGDGEGHEIQAYRLQPAEAGIYTALLENPATNVAIPYTLEAYLESDFVLEAAAEPLQASLGETVVLTATLTRGDAAQAGSTVEARVRRPDGSVSSLPLLDDGNGADLLAGDGLYTGKTGTADQPGVHDVEVTATETAGALMLYRREATTRFHVASDAASFAGFTASGSTDQNEDGVQDALWIDGALDVTRPGVFLVTGVLEAAGQSVAESGTLLSIAAPGVTTFRLHFGGPEIYAAQVDGPYILAEAVCLDGSAGFVEADRVTNAHTTGAISWQSFGRETDAPHEPFSRGDVNLDTHPDISDSVAIFAHLFLGGEPIACRDGADTNDDGALDISDGVYLLGFLFAGGPAPAAPFPACGADATPDSLECEAYEPCGNE